MNGWDIFWKAAQSNPGSIGIMIFGLVCTVIYGVQIWWRVSLVEKKLGLRTNGTSSLEVVVTKADLIQFEKNLIETLRAQFVSSEICVLRHDQTVDRVEAMEEEQKRRDL